MMSQKNRIFSIVLGYYLLSSTWIFSEEDKWEENALHKSFKTIAEQPGAVSFQPPEGWFIANSKSLPVNVKLMVVGKGAHEFPPSINLAYDNFKGTLKEYLNLINAINKRTGAESKDLGMIRTSAGEARLLQIDSKNEWGDERQMQIIIIKNNQAFILTASALKEEFSKFYPQFFKALKSFKINGE